MDLVLAAHLNPVYLDLSHSLANLRHATLPLDEQRQNQVVVQLTNHDLQCVAFDTPKSTLLSLRSVNLILSCLNKPKKQES